MCVCVCICLSAICQGTLTNPVNQCFRAGPKLRYLQQAGEQLDGVKLVGDAGTAQLKSMEVTDAMISALDKRMSDVTDGILMATTLADLKTWPPAAPPSGMLIHFHL